MLTKATLYKLKTAKHSDYKKTTDRLRLFFCSMFL